MSRTELIDSYLRRLFPLHRSITGDANRTTLKILQELIPLQILEYSSGESVYDWTIPQEWQIHEAWIKNRQGEKIVDLNNNNLHVVSYSRPVHAFMNLAELKPHLHYLQDQPRAIPYRTSYYQDDWGFCLSYLEYQRYFSDDGPYEVYINAEHFPGSLSIGELLIPGRSTKEILISTYLCHPSMANDNLSGVLTTALMAQTLMQIDLQHSYRVLFVPETIGAIAYCCHHEQQMQQVSVGLVVTTTGGPGAYGYKQSYCREHWLNEMVEAVFLRHKIDFTVYPFDPHGSDERQYSSPAFRIPCVSLCKSKYYEYPEYHTSLDNLKLVKAETIANSLQLYEDLLFLLDQNVVFENLKPYGEVMLSKHDLYPKTGAAFIPDKTGYSELDYILWLLFLCDGTQSLWDIAKRLGVEQHRLFEIAGQLEAKGILKRHV